MSANTGTSPAARKALITGSTSGIGQAAAERLSDTTAFYLLASVTVTFLAGSSAPTPIYALYQEEWLFSSITMTIIFGIYALAVLGALLVAGRLSDHIGRRPVLIAATLAQAATMWLFATAHGVTDLLVARVIQGLSTGAAVAAVGAGLLDLDRTRGAIANAVAPMLGTATGAIAAGLAVQFLPAPTQLVYAILGVVFVAQGAGIALMKETVTPRAGAWSSLVPQFSVPSALRTPVAFAIPALIATWALAGFYGSLGPTLLRGLLGFGSPLLGGLALFVLAGSGSLSVLLLQKHDPRRMLGLGALGLFAGVAITLASLGANSVIAFFAGTALAGAGFGAGFQGAVRTVVPFAKPHERAGVLSVLFVVSYLAMGVPAVLAGFLVVHDGSVIATAREFGSVVMILAAIALAGTLWRDPA